MGTKVIGAITLKDLRERLHGRVLRLRSIDAWIHSDRLSDLWGQSTECQRQNLVDLIRREDAKGVIAWMNNHNKRELGEESVRFLRTRARFLRIRNYSRLDKGELITAIKAKEENNG